MAFGHLIIIDLAVVAYSRCIQRIFCVSRLPKEFGSLKVGFPYISVHLAFKPRRYFPNAHLSLMSNFFSSIRTG